MSWCLEQIIKLFGVNDISGIKISLNFYGMGFQALLVMLREGPSVGRIFCHTCKV